MPKMKTKRAAAKRFRVLGSGKFKRAKMGRRHGLSNKSRRRRVRLGVVALVDARDQHSVERMLPYLK